MPGGHPDFWWTERTGAPRVLEGTVTAVRFKKVGVPILSVGEDSGKVWSTPEHKGVVEAATRAAFKHGPLAGCKVRIEKTGTKPNPHGGHDEIVYAVRFWDQQGHPFFDNSLSPELQALVDAGDISLERAIQIQEAA